MALKKKARIEQSTKGVKRKPEDSQLDDDASTTPIKAARKTRTADDLASRAVKEHSADFTDHQIHVIRAEANENRTLQEELVLQNELSALEARLPLSWVSVTLALSLPSHVAE